MHDELFKHHKPRILEETIPMAKGRIMQEAYWRKLRIDLNYDLLDSFSVQYPNLASKIGISRRLLARVKRYFESTLEVYSLDVLTFKPSTCNGQSLQGFSKEVDLMIYVTPETQDKGYFAAAVSCYQNPIDQRSSVGIYFLSFVNMKDTKLHEYMYYSTFAHEFTHILGFSANLYGLFVDSSRNIIGQSNIIKQEQLGDQTFNFFSHPIVKKAAIDFFNCKALPGIPLQMTRGDVNKVNSHWDRKFLPVEYMNPLVENPGHISRLSLSLLESSGWYKVNVQNKHRLITSMLRHIN